jgi:hypothetical protein
MCTEGLMLNCTQWQACLQIVWLWICTQHIYKRTDCEFHRAGVQEDWPWTSQSRFTDFLTVKCTHWPSGVEWFWLHTLTGRCKAFLSVKCTVTNRCNICLTVNCKRWSLRVQSFWMWTGYTDQQVYRISDCEMHTVTGIRTDCLTVNWTQWPAGVESVWHWTAYSDQQVYRRSDCGLQTGTNKFIYCDNELQTVTIMFNEGLSVNGSQWPVGVQRALECTAHIARQVHRRTDYVMPHKI